MDMNKDRYHNKAPFSTFRPDPRHWTRKGSSWKQKVGYDTEDEAWEFWEEATATDRYPVLSADGSVVEVAKMPGTARDLLDFLRRYKDDSVCVLERVGGMPGNGAHAMFNFGKGFGHLQMALLALEIPTEDVTPNKWEKAFQMGSSGKFTKREWKNLLKAKAQQLFPKLGRKVTLDTCDALLIAEYGRRLGL